MRQLGLIENIKLAKYYTQHYRDVYNFLYLNPEQIRDFQFNQIKKLVTLAFDETEFYRQKYSRIGFEPEDLKSWSDFEKLPTVTKEELIENHDKCIVTSKKNKKDLIVSKSSGSSGKVIDVIYEGNAYIKEALITLRMFQQSFDYSIFDKQALIYTSLYPYQSIAGFYKANYIFTLTPVEEIIRKLIKMQPQFIVSYPSVLMDIIKIINKSDLKKLYPKAISTNSEYSSPHQRKLISSFFKCSVFDEYSSEELARIAFQCKNDNYHIQEDCSYIEILNPDNDKNCVLGEMGEVVGTCFLNEVMPFIRYRQGDLGILDVHKCACGNNGRIFAKISGRKNSSFYKKDGSIIPSGLLLDWTYELILKNKIPILQFQLIQQSYDQIEFDIILISKVNIKQTQQIIQQSFTEYFGRNFIVKMNIVKSIPKTPAGKHIPIKSLVKV